MTTNTPTYAGGTSSDLIVDYVRTQISMMQPHRVVDFGAGLGKMGRIVREAVPQAQITAVDGCKLTAGELAQAKVYDHVHIDMLESWIARNVERYDLAIFGDVLEHLTRRQALKAINATLRFASNIIVNIPLRNLHQDGHDDNPLEAHRGYFTEHCFDSRFIVREKHVASPSLGYTKMNIWITGRKQFRLKNMIKGQLLRHFGRPAKLALEKLGYDSYVSG